MCRAQWDDGGRRCDGRLRPYYRVNREGHDRHGADVEQERHFYLVETYCSKKPDAIRKRRERGNKRAAEVEAIRTIHGLECGAPIGPVRRKQLHVQRYHGASVTYVIYAEQCRLVAEEEGTSPEEVAARHERDVVRPSRQDAGQRIADLIVERPEWVDPDHLVRMIEPPENGDPNPSYCRVVTDLDGVEHVLVTSFDGSEPMVWMNTAEGLYAAAAECLERVRAVNSDRTAYDQWLSENGAGPSAGTWSPYTEQMETADFLANAEGMHLV